MQSLRFFDIHTHTQFAAFKDDQDAVIQRALDAGVWMINVGTQQDTSKAAIDTAHRYPEGVYAAVGLHPVHTEKSYHDEQELGTFQHSAEYENVDGASGSGFNSREEEFDYEYYKKLAEDLKVVAIGECGLDYYRMDEYITRKKQHTAFVDQIVLAHDVQKPLMIHCREAFCNLLGLLWANREHLLSRGSGVIHFFTGTVDDAKQLLDLGFSFSFGGVITFARDYDEVIKYIPLDRLLLETDAPYVTPVPYRGKRNEPAYVKEVCKQIAELKQVSEDEVSTLTSQNAQAMFPIE